MSNLAMAKNNVTNGWFLEIGKMVQNDIRISDQSG